MKIKRFFAPDMRQALRQVRETFGADAVILSNKSVDGGVELVAAMDYDDATATAETASSAPAPGPARGPEPEITTAYSKARTPGQVSSLVERLQARGGEASPPLPQSPPAAADADGLAAMRKELTALRRMVENGLAGLAWQDLGYHRAHTQELLRQLIDLDLHPGLCEELARAEAATEDPDLALRLALKRLAEALPVGGTDFLEEGGVVALVGPTGVGKTTTLAKLAARFALRRGSRQLALVTTDNYRIGAEEQLHSYGRLLDVPVRTALDAEGLEQALELFSDRRLVLIDTAGMSQRDLRLNEQLAMLRGRGRPVQVLLALSATTDAATLEQALEAFSGVRPSACVLTKLDEACSLGGLLSSLVRRRLPMAFTTDGQRVPEDIHVARPHSLVKRAVELARAHRETPGEAWLAMQLGGVHQHVGI